MTPHQPARRLHSPGPRSRGMGDDEMNLDEEYRRMAEKASVEGVPNDAEPMGAIHRWVAENVNHRPETAFFIVLGISAAMADMDAQSEGYRNQFDRSLKNLQN